MSQVKAGKTTSAKPRTQKGSKIGQRGAPEIYLWSLDDDAFFRHYGGLEGKQRRFYASLRRNWKQRFVTEEWNPGVAEHVDALKDIRALCALGIIVREDAEAFGRRIKAEQSASDVRATD